MLNFHGVTTNNMTTGTASIEATRERALDSCTRKGASDCRLYAENLTVSGGDHASSSPAIAPATLITGSGYAFVPDDRFLWYEASAATGIIVWGHGYAGDDERGSQPPAFLRTLNNDGYSVVRFDREPGEDIWVDRQTQHLRDGLIELRRRGWKRIVAGGQSRGGWNAFGIAQDARRG